MAYELYTLPENLNIPAILSGVCVAQSLGFWIIVCLFAFFLLTIVFDVLLFVTPFGFLKLFIITFKYWSTSVVQ